MVGDSHGANLVPPVIDDGQEITKSTLVLLLLSGVEGVLLKPVENLGLVGGGLVCRG